MLKCTAAVLKAQKKLTTLFYIGTCSEIVTIPKELHKTNVKKHKFLLSINKQQSIFLYGRNVTSYCNPLKILSVTAEMGKLLSKSIAGH